MANSAALTGVRVTLARTILTEPSGHFSSPIMANGTFDGRRKDMTDSEMAAYLRENGYPEHVVRAGRAGLIERWRKFVEEVERGYKLGLEDYRNDLDLRGIIAMLGLDEEVRDLDRRFEAMLTNREKRVWESSASDPFWDFGYPSNASARLLEDITNEGLAS